MDATFDVCFAKKVACDFAVDEGSQLCHFRVYLTQDPEKEWHRDTLYLPMYESQIRILRDSLSGALAAQEADRLAKWKAEASVEDLLRNAG